jgi:hypothetical protein
MRLAHLTSFLNACYFLAAICTASDLAVEKATSTDSDSAPSVANADAGAAASAIPSILANAVAWRGEVY